MRKRRPWAAFSLLRSQALVPLDGRLVEAQEARGVVAAPDREEAEVDGVRIWLRPAEEKSNRGRKPAAAKATAEIANATKFWSVWNEFSRESKLNTFATRAREIKAKAKELQRGRFEAQFDYSAVVMLYVTAIRQLGGKHFAL